MLAGVMMVPRGSQLARLLRRIKTLKVSRVGCGTWVATSVPVEQHHVNRLCEVGHTRQGYADLVQRAKADQPLDVSHRALFGRHFELTHEPFLIVGEREKGR